MVLFYDLVMVGLLDSGVPGIVTSEVKDLILSVTGIFRLLSSFIIL